MSFASPQQYHGSSRRVVAYVDNESSDSNREMLSERLNTPQTEDLNSVELDHIIAAFDSEEYN